MSLKQNFMYSSILTVSTYLFPLLVYPYVSRVLGLSNIGIVNFVDNLINYFVCISMMGIATVGVREIAAARNDKERLSSTFMSLLSLTAITTLIAVIALWIAMYTVPTLVEHRELLYVGIVKLSFNLLLIEWFFTGMEDFRYITNRSILVKCLYVLCVFLFVKDASDYKVYYVLSVAMVVVNALINVVYSRRFIRYSFRSIDMRPFLRAYIIMGIYVLLINVYYSLNTVWLGFVTDTDEVGYFTTATKLHTIIMAVLSSFTNILYPRVSSLLAQGKEEEFWHKITVSLEAVFLFAFPTIAFMLVAGPQLLYLVVGGGFEGSYLPLRIITPLVLIIGVEQIFVIQILMSRHQDNAVLRNCFLGAVISLLFNVALTASLGAPGSAIVWVAAEFSILCLSLADVHRKFHYAFPYRRVLAYTVVYLPLVVLSCLLYHVLSTSLSPNFSSSHFLNSTFSESLILSISIATLTFVYACFTEVFVLKNKVALYLLQSVHLHPKQ